MNFKELQELIKLISKTNLTEFKYKKGDEEISIRTKKYHKKKIVTAGTAPAPIVHVPQPAAPAPQGNQPQPAQPSETPNNVTSPETEAKKEEANADANLVEVKSPIVGTFYRSASPEKPPFIKVGDRIEAGQVVCIVEAMKLFNEIESEVSGEVVKVVAEDASPVEYDQVLFLVDPSK